MKKKSTPRSSAVLTVAAVVLSALGSGLAGASAATAATAASSAGWCNGKTYDTFPSGAKGYVPTYNGKWNCTMSRGASGEHVEVLQRTLKDCYNQRITVDGQFGPATETALRYAQNMTDPMYPANIEGDGVYGPITAEYLSHYATKSGSTRCSSLHG
ncbi:peptidoglycan-binding protein [Streptomyces sp. NPDC020731]|uniref:peptidoglycan-binding protein n=1 Tax=Streptomyces sp. NPDC020731 TaxID=3365085 RepID=UPI00379F4DE2